MNLLYNQPQTLIGIYLTVLRSSKTIGMSSSKKKNAPLPASSAGLLRFFEDETKGIKVRPELVLGIAGGIIGVSILIRLVLPV